MSGRERELERALTKFDRTGDEELDALVDTAEDLTNRFAAQTPGRPEARAMFIEGVGARKRSIMSSLALPGLAVVILLLALAVFGRSALPGESLYPVRNVLRSAGLAEAPDEDIKREIDDAVLSIGRARVASERDLPLAERLAVAALMSLGRAEGYLDEVGAADRALYEDRIDSLRLRAIALIRATLDEDDNSGPGSGDDNSGPGSDDSGSDDSGDSSGSGSDDSGSGDSSGSGSDDPSESSGPGSDGSGDSSGSGSGDDN
jgi:hypothetical protein